MATRVYLAARYSRRLELCAKAVDLEARGYRIASSWIDGHHETRPGIDDTASDGERAVWAMEDLNDLTRADWLVFFAEAPHTASRGGRMVEFGYFLAKREEHEWKRMIVIGPRESVFHCLPFVEPFDTWAALLETL